MAINQIDLEDNRKNHQLPNYAYKGVYIPLLLPVNYFMRFIGLSYIFLDINELNLPKTCNTDFPDPDDLLNFKLVICPDEGYYRGGRFIFNFRVGPNYPHEPPKVKCETQVYHPNIDLEGNVCLNILREDWNPVLTINSIVYGLQYLFLVYTYIRRYTCIKRKLYLLMKFIIFFQEPNPEDPLNKEAADVLQSNPRLFEHNVSKAMRGNFVGETYFECCLK